MRRSLQLPLRMARRLAPAVAALTLAIPGVAAADGLAAVGHAPPFSLQMGEARIWIDAANRSLEGAGGAHRIALIGGPETVAPDGLIAALRDGAFAIGIADSASYRELVPEIRALALSRRDPAAERKVGLHAAMVDAHRRQGLRYIGRIRYAPFYVWTRRRVTAISELKGMKIQVADQHGAFVRRFGMSPVEISVRDTYQALKVGKIEGFGWSPLGPRARGWLRRVRHRIDLPLYRAENVVCVMNLKNWRRLKSVHRKAIATATAGFEGGMARRMARRIRAEEAALTRFGIGRIRFSRKENRRFRRAAYDAEWTALARVLPRDQVARLRKLTGR